ATIRNMKQNTIFAVATVVFLLIGVLKGDVHLASGMFIHEASVLLVILNGMRLITFKERQPINPKQEVRNDHESKKLNVWQKGAGRMQKDTERKNPENVSVVGAKSDTKREGREIESSLGAKSDTKREGREIESSLGAKSDTKRANREIESSLGSKSDTKRE